MSVKIGTAAFTLIVGIALAGCSGIFDPAVGKGPITLGPDVEKAFAEYRGRATPRYFAVSEDGQSYYYSFCDVGRCTRQAKTQVVEKCEAYSGGVPCKIYASSGTIVWARDIHTSFLN